MTTTIISIIITTITQEFIAEYKSQIDATDDVFGAQICWWQNLMGPVGADKLIADTIGWLPTSDVPQIAETAAQHCKNSAAVPSIKLPQKPPVS